MKFVLEITTGNEAVQTPNDIVSILNGAQNTLNRYSDLDNITNHNFTIRDANGNKVGTWKIIEED